MTCLRALRAYRSILTCLYVPLRALTRHRIRDEKWNFKILFCVTNSQAWIDCYKFFSQFPSIRTILFIYGESKHGPLVTNSYRGPWANFYNNNNCSNKNKQQQHHHHHHHHHAPPVPSSSSQSVPPWRQKSVVGGSTGRSALNRQAELGGWSDSKTTVNTDTTHTILCIVSHITSSHILHVSCFTCITYILHVSHLMHVSFVLHISHASHVSHKCMY